MSKQYTKNPPSRILGSNLKPVGWYTAYSDPPTFSSWQTVRALFAEIDKHDDVSDIILKSGSPVAIKSKGLGLKAITHRCLSHSEVVNFCRLLTDDDSITSRITKGKPISGQANVLNEEAFDSERGIQESKYRYRYEITACSSLNEERGLSVIMRPLPDAPLSYAELGIPREFIEKCIVPNGIVIFAGATGEGKSTSLAAVIRYILETETIIKGNIITHEDPIEVTYEKILSKHSIVMQSQIGEGNAHICSFQYANRSAMRRSPDLVLLGELRDEDTIQSAVELSLTGHPVLATTHATNIASIFPRLISRFPKQIQSQKGYDLVDTTRFLVAQRLIRTKDGKRMAVREQLQFTESLRSELIKYAQDIDKLNRIIGNIMKNEDFGAISFESQAVKLRDEGVIDDVGYNRLVANANSEVLNDLEKLRIKKYSEVDV